MNADPLLSAIENGRFKIETAKSGAPTLVVDGVYLHSRYDPQKEADRFIESQKIERDDLLVAVGLGLGYAAQAALERGARVLAVEPDEALLRFVKPRLSFKENPSFRCVAGGDASAFESAFKSLFRPLESGRIHVQSCANFPPEWNPVLERVKSWSGVLLDALIAHAKTLAAFGALWVENILENLPAAAQGLTIAPWRNRLGGSGTPCALLAAGPSLEEDLPILKTVQDHIVILSTDTAYPAALKAGVRPDAVVTVDPQPHSRRHFVEAGLTEPIPVIADGLCDPGVVQGASGPVLFFSTDHPLLRELGLFPAAAVIPDGGSSVATVAFRLARFLGCDPVVLIGQDLSLPGERMYSRGTVLENEWARSAGRFATVESKRRAHWMDRNLRPVPSNDGKTVFTTPNLDEYRRWFERAIAQEKIENPSRRVVHTSPHGAKIEGASFERLADWVSSLASQKKPQFTIPRRDRTIAEKAPKNLKRLMERLKSQVQENDPLVEPLLYAKLFPAVRELTPAKRQEALAVAVMESKMFLLKRMEASYEKLLR